MFVNVLAETAPAPAEGGFNFTTLILLAVFAVFIFLMFRKNKKAQKAVQEQQSQMAPGVEVMTSYGLFGTVISTDDAENKVVLETSPGNTVTVHRQSVTKIIPVAEEEEETVVPDDASTLTGERTSPATTADERVDGTDAVNGTPAAGQPHQDEKDKDR